MRFTMAYQNKKQESSVQKTMKVTTFPNNPQLPKDNWSVNITSYVWISFKALWIQEFERKNTNERKNWF